MIPDSECDFKCDLALPVDGETAWRPYEGLMIRSDGCT